MEQPKSYTLFIQGIPPLEMVSTVDLVKQYNDQVQLMVKGKMQLYEPIQFKDEEGEVMMMWHAAVIKGMVVGVTQANPPPGRVGEIPDERKE